MQGFNMGRYHAPSALDTSLTSTPTTSKRKRQTSSSTTAPAGQTVRFEMPFATWCTTCPQPTIIPQGVRFNALKQRDGSYYTTPIWKFTLKHTVCGGEVVIRTDPKNTEYEVLSGGRRRDYGDEADTPQTSGEKTEQRKDAFRKLEKTIADEEVKKGARERIEALQGVVDRSTWDPYERNQALRRTFRVGRKEREEQARRDEELKERLGTGVELLAESEEDRLRAGIVEFGGMEGDALRKPLFEGRDGGKEEEEGMLKRDRAVKRRKDGFVSQVMGNTRLGRDPFLSGDRPHGKGSSRLPGVKRKKEEVQEGDAERLPETKPAAAALVNYDSD